MKIVGLNKDALTIELNAPDLYDLQKIFEHAEGCGEQEAITASAMKLVCELGNEAIDGKYTDMMYRDLQVKTNNAPWLKDVGESTG